MQNPTDFGSPALFMVRSLALPRTSDRRLWTSEVTKITGGNCGILKHTLESVQGLEMSGFFSTFSRRPTKRKTTLERQTPRPNKRDRLLDVTPQIITSRQGRLLASPTPPVEAGSLDQRAHCSGQGPRLPFQTAQLRNTQIGLDFQGGRADPQLGLELLKWCKEVPASCNFTQTQPVCKMSMYVHIYPPTLLGVSDT